ncbi:hypothetical protein CDR19_06560 [Ectopseudomonas toyotomiensis]|uniref:Uncharacterized protein n=1 Tax=Ectopseudomonas toyotomiensis TaxID=554344 RepID=A0A1I5TMC7_9GAMM|nr:MULTISPECIES: hypothetical protein [Pseudomonas]PIA73819.1 hypothetical protein CDR19_06560 [Pseudomonas toyotomiensis]SDA44890.1 hypothetical protein SAMN03159475_0328 [Pseudomonas sp. NFPP33]SFP84041.1 hypothetical protein SAMN05216177_105264 [Pseudomonas toyotomiensis]
MLKSVRWVEDRILSLKISENKYGLAQMRKNHLMEFFGLFQDEDKWENVDLNKEQILFCLFVAENRLKPLYSSIIESETVIPNSRPIIKRMLSANLGQGLYGGAKLIELTDDYSQLPEKVIRPNLSTKDDLEIIYSHELCGMYGDPEKIRKRIQVFIESGINWDESKDFVFRGVPLPRRANE